MKALAILVSVLALTACSSQPERRELELGRVTSSLSLSDANTIPFPIDPPSPFTGEPKITWDGTLVDLLAADAFGMCWSLFPVPLADRYLAYLETKMAQAECGPATSNGTVDHWIKQRTHTDYLACNYRGSTRTNALIELPAEAASDQWMGADSFLYDPSGVIPPRWSAYDLFPTPTPTPGTDTLTWFTAVYEAVGEVLTAASNLCMANRLREQMLTMDVLALSGTEQRQLLSVIRERAQIAMLELAVLGRAFSNESANETTVTDAKAFLPVLRMHYERLTADQKSQLAADLASAVRLHIEVTHEFAELLARSAAARSDLADIGGSGYPAEFEDAEWGSGGWRSRALNLLYGGDPLGSLISWTPGAPRSSNVVWGGIAGFGGPWDGEQILTASLSQPEVQTLLALARSADVLYMKRIDGFPTYDVTDSSEFLWRAVESHLRNTEANCLDPAAACYLKADSPDVATIEQYTNGLLWKRYRVAPEHARALAKALSEGLPPPHGLFAGRAAFHFSGDLSTVALPPNLINGTGMWEHLAKDFSFATVPLAVRASARAVSGSFYMPDTFVNEHYASAQGFVGSVTVDWAPFFAGDGTVNDSMRTLGSVQALAAVRESLFAGNQSGGAPGLYDADTTAIKEVLGLIESAIGPETVAVRPVLVPKSVTVPVQSPPLPCGEWADQSDSSCTVLAMDMPSNSTDTVKGIVDILRPSGSPPVQVLLVTAAAVQGINEDPYSIRHIANLATQADFKSPAYNLGYPTLLETQRIERAELNTLADSSAVSATPTENNNLSLVRDRYEIQWKVDSEGFPLIAAPVLLAVTDTTPRQYAVLADNFALPNFNRGEVSSTPVFRSEGGYYFGSGGSLGVYAARLMERHPTEWKRPVFDGFGYPIDWTPPVTPELLAGASDPIAFYLTGAKEAAQDATTAVTKALDQVIQESADNQKKQASRARAAEISTLEREAVCGARPCDADTIGMTDVNLPVALFCLQPNEACASLYKQLETLPASFRILSVVNDALSANAPPSFDAFEGGSLQTLALDQWNAIKKLQRIFAEATPRLQGVGYTINAARENYVTQIDQFNKQADTDNAEVAVKRADKEWLCDNEIPRKQAFNACVSYKAEATPFFMNGANSPFITPMGYDTDQSQVNGMNLGPLWAYWERCRQAQGDLYLAEQRRAPHAVQNYKAAGESYSAAIQQGYEAAAAILSSAIAALADIRKAEFAITQALAGLERTHKKIEFDTYVEQSGTASQLAITRRYHQPDMWRARALLDNARRLSVAARRSIESRYNVDLSAMREDEPFVAAPALWADEVYEYDLDPPSAVGLSRAGGAVGGIYPNKLLDYVRNLENFVRGYPVRRPTAAMSSDSEVVTLPGPGAIEDVDGVSGVGGDTIGPDANRWSFQCEEGGPWVSNPLNEPPGESVLNYTFEELTPPFKNHGLGLALNATVASGTTPTALPAISGYAANLNGGYLATAPTQVGESAGGLTISAWVNLRAYTTVQNTNQIIVGKNYNATGWADPWASAHVGVTSTGYLVAKVKVGSQNFPFTTTCPISLKQWSHVAMTFDGTALRAYKNGASCGTLSTGSQPGSIDWGTHGAWMLGGLPATSPYFINGWLGHVRIDTRAHAPDELNAEYLRGVAEGGTAATWKFQESAPPYASTGSIASIPLNTGAGASVSVAAPPFESVADFNGASCVESAATTAGETPQQITLAAWVYPRAHATNIETKILAKPYGATWVYPYIAASLSTFNGTPRGMVSVGGLPYLAGTANVLPLNTWSHLGMTFDGTVIKLYVNGIDAGTGTVPTASAPAYIDWGSHQPWMIGGNCVVNAEYFNGQVAEARVDPVVRPHEFFSEAYGRGLAGKCFYDTACEVHGDCCPDRQPSPLDDMCPNGRPTRARIEFHIDPWGRESGDFAQPPFNARHNVRWGRLAVNLVGTGVRDCAGAVDTVSCYAQSFLRYDLSHAGPVWSTDFNEQWHIRSLPIGQIEGGKALTAEEWLDPIANSWNQPFVSNVARSELIKRPVSGIYTLNLALGSEVRADRIRRVQILMETEYWVSQR